MSTRVFTRYIGIVTQQGCQFGLKGYRHVPHIFQQFIHTGNRFLVDEIKKILFLLFEVVRARVQGLTFRHFEKWYDRAAFRRSVSEYYSDISSGVFFASSGQLKSSVKELIPHEATHFPKSRSPQGLMVRTKDTRKKTNGVARKALRRSLTNSGFARPPKKDTPIKCARTVAINVGTNPPDSEAFFKQRVDDLFGYYNKALVIAIMCALGDIKDTNGSSAMTPVKQRESLAVRLINKYAQKHKGEGRSASNLMDIAMRDISVSLAFRVICAVDDVSLQYTGRKAASIADRAMEDVKAWKHRFLQYYREYFKSLKAVQLESDGSIIPKSAFECVFYTVYKRYSFGFPIPEVTVARLEIGGKVIQFPETTVWSNYRTRSIELEKTSIPMPSTLNE